MHDDYYPQTTKDPVLLAELGERGWVLLTQDDKIRFRTPERDAYLRANLRVFVASSANLLASTTAAIFSGARKKIEQVCERESGPFVYSVHKDSSVHKLD